MANIPPSNLIINGIDLTTVFARYISGPKASPTGIIINNQDLCNIFAPYMIGLKASPTGVLIAGGVDLCNVFLPLNAIILISPTNLSLSNVTTSTASLSFSTVSGATSYLATTNTGITGSSLSFPMILEGLAAGTFYKISLQSINNWGISYPTQPINVTTYPVVPSLSSTISDISMTIVYTPFETLTYYTSTVTTTLGGSSSLFSSSTGSLSFNGLTNNTTYNIVFLASNISGQSIPYKTSYTTSPGRPTILSTSNLTSTSLSLTFSTSVGASSYLATTTSGITAASTSSPITINGLSSNTSYTITIQSINNGLYSQASNGITTNTLPDPPTSLTSISGNSSIQIGFTPPSGTITGYLATTTSGITAASTSSPITINGLSSNTSYTITIQSINNGTYSSASNGITRNTLPNPPTSLTSMSGNTTESSIQISFTPPSGTITGYLATTTSGITAASTSSPITINGLSSNTSYTITIQAINNGLYSQASNGITTNTLPPLINPNSIALTYINKKATNFQSNGGAAISDTGQYILIGKAKYSTNVYYPVMVSSNYGTSWTDIYLNIFQYAPSCVSVSGSGQYMAMSGGNPQQGVWISNDYGVTWALFFAKTNVNINAYCKIASNGETALIIDPWGQAWLFSKDTNGNFSSSSPSVSLHNNVTSKTGTSTTAPAFNGGNTYWGIDQATISGNGKVIYFGNPKNYYISTNSGTSFTTYNTISTNGGSSYISYGMNNSYWPWQLGGASMSIFAAISYDGKYIAYFTLSSNIVINDNYGNSSNWKTILTSVSTINLGTVKSISNDGSSLLVSNIAGISSTAGQYLYFSSNYGTTFQANPGNINTAIATSVSVSFSNGLISGNGNFMFVVSGDDKIYTYKQQ